MQTKYLYLNSRGELFRMAFIMSLMFSPACIMAQKSDRLQTVVQAVSAYTQNQSKLSSDKLAKATMIVYHSGNGSVAPEYHYDCYVNVVKNNVNVIVYGGYEGTVRYNKNHTISDAAYKQFLNSLLKQDIRKTPSNDNDFMMSGAGSSDITVKVKQQVIFEGEEDMDVSIAKGRLVDSFMALLPDDMKRVVRNPDIVLNKK